MIRNYRIGLFCDREDWILGTTARAIVNCVAQLGDFEFLISSQKRIFAQPLNELRSLRRCGVIHWISPYGYVHFGPLFPTTPQVCTIHHCLAGDEHWPANYKGIKVLTMSHQTRQQLVQRGFVDVDIIHYGVDAELFYPLPQVDCRRKLGLEQESYPLIGFFGKGSSNPSDRKGTSTLVEALVLVNRHRRVGVLLSGEGWDALIGRLRTADVPVFHCQIDSLQNMPWLYGAIDLYLCTSRVEGGPVTILEAMASERPVVTTPVGHVPELVQHGENGLVVSIEDSRTTADTIETLLDHPTWVRRLGEAGRQTILNGWTWNAVLQPLAGVYKTVAESGTAAKYSVNAYSRSFLMLLMRSLYRRMFAAH